MTAAAAPVLGLLWAALVLAAAATRRPAPARVRTLVRAGTPAAPRPAATARRGRADVRATVGRAVLRLVERAHRPRTPAGRATDDPRRDDRARQIGSAAIAASTAVVALPTPPFVAAAIAAAAAWWWPVHRRRRQRRRRADGIERAVPDVVDLFLLAVEAGLTVPLALRAVADHCGPHSGPLADELGRAVHEIDLGRRAADAIDDLAAPHRAGDAVRPLAAALAASERYGAPLADALARLADDARRTRRRRAEEAARRLPVTLLFPLVTCTLPAFGLLTVGPLLASALRSLRL